MRCVFTSELRDMAAVLQVQVLWLCEKNQRRLPVGVCGHHITRAVSL